jgi:hypothetical protein
MVQSLAIEMTGFFLGVIFTVLFNWGRGAVIDRRPARRLLRLDLSRPIWIVIASGRDRDQVELTELVFPAEAKAAAEIEAFIKSLDATAKVRIAVSGAIPPEALRDNLIVIGGPINNSVARRLGEICNIPYRFDGWELIGTSGQRFVPTIGSDRIERDYAMTVLAPNPFSTGGGLVWIAGCRTFGCLGGARLLLRGDVRRTLTATEGAWPVAIVSTCLVESGEVFRVSVEESTPFAMEA